MFLAQSKPQPRGNLHLVFSFVTATPVEEVEKMVTLKGYIFTLLVYIPDTGVQFEGSKLVSMQFSGLP